MSSKSNAGLSQGILQIHWSFPPTTGGVESHISDLARALGEGGHRVVVLTGEDAPKCCGRYKVICTSLLNLESIKKSRMSKTVMVSRLRELLLDLVRRFAIRIVHGHNLHHFNPAPAIAVEAIRRQCQLGVFHTFHETWPDVLSEEPVYHLWNENYAVSRHVQRECTEIFGFTPRLAHLGVDTSLFRTNVKCFNSNPVPVILHPARLLPWKGVELSVRALRLLFDRGFTAVLWITDTQRIADWKDELAAYRSKIMALIGELQLGPHVRFVQASYADMPRLYEEADIVVYPTLGEEPYGLVPVEAMSCGRPVVASCSGGIPETVIDGVTGYIVPVGNADALADRLAGLISRPQLARRLGDAGRRHVRDNFDARRYVSALLEDFLRQ